MIPDGFLRDEKWWEDLGHIGIGIVPMWGSFRERSQWPPGEPFEVLKADGWRGVVTQIDRVEDAYRDFFGYEVGATVRMVGLLIGLVVFL